MLHASKIPRGDVVSLSPGRLEFVKGVETLFNACGYAVDQINLS